MGFGDAKGWIHPWVLDEIEGNQKLFLFWVLLFAKEFGSITLGILPNVFCFYWVYSNN